MEQNLSLLQLLAPVAITLSVIIGAGLGVLLLLQSAKSAAILRVLGYRKIRTRVMLCTEHILVVLVGTAIGLSVMILLNIGYVLELLLLAGLYLSGAAIGSVIGAVIITKRAPLELLQVRE